MKVKLEKDNVLEVEVEQEGRKAFATIKGGFHNNFCTIDVIFPVEEECGGHYTLAGGIGGKGKLIIFGHDPEDS